MRLYGVSQKGPVRLDVPAEANGFVGMLAAFPLGVYSALCTFDHNKFLDLEAHLARTLNSLTLIGWDYAFDESRFRGVLHQVVTDYPLPNSRVRFDILAEPVVRQGVAIQELISLRPFSPVPAQYYDIGIGVDLSQEIHRRNPLAKTADFAQQREPLALGKARDHYEQIIVDEEGRLLEGMMTNFWAVKDGMVYTAEAGVLQGVTRKIILSLLPELGIPLSMQAVQRHELPDLQEAAISGSSRALLPVVQINGQMIGDGRPGAVCKKILRAYEHYVAQAVRPAQV